MQSKLSIVLEHMAANRWQKALSVAAKFSQLGEHRDAIQLAHDAYTHPHFYRQIGKNIEALQTAGQTALIERFAK